MKQTVILLLTLAVASYLAVAYAGKGEKGHGHEKAGAGKAAEHHSAAEGAMALQLGNAGL